MLTSIHSCGVRSVSFSSSRESHANTSASLAAVAASPNTAAAPSMSSPSTPPPAKRARIDGGDGAAASTETTAVAGAPSSAPPSSLPPQSMTMMPRTVDDVKRRMAALREARQRRDEKAQAAAAASSYSTSAGSASPAPSMRDRPPPRAAPSSAGAAAVSSSLPSLPSLLTLRVERERALEAKRALEHRLGSLLWIECAKQAAALEFLQRGSAGSGGSGSGGNASDDETTASASDSTQLRLFTCELPAHVRRDGTKVSSGARRFIVSSYADFYTRYFSFRPAVRHHYEVILERAPCHLYFDIECKWKHNPQLRQPGEETDVGGKDCDGSVDVERVMAALCEELVAFLNESFGSDIVAASVENILQLDSSSSVKFSRHLIVRLAGPQSPPPDHVVTAAAAGSASTTAQPPLPSPPPPPPCFMFRDNAHVGRFVRAFCLHLTRRIMQASKQHGGDASTAADPSVASLSVEDRTAERAQLLRYLYVYDEDSAATTSEGYDAFGAILSSAPRPASSAASRTSVPLLQPPAPHSPSACSLIDQGVYSRNRSFRLFLSSKNARVAVAERVRMDAARTYGTAVATTETAPTLLVADTNRYPLAGRSLRDIFMDALVCNVQCAWNELRLLCFSETDQASIVPASSFERRPGGALYSATEEGGSDPNAAAILNANGKRARPSSMAAGSNKSTNDISGTPASSGSRRFLPIPSPFPALEQWLLKQLRPRSPDARIRGWTYFKEASASSAASSSSSSDVARHSVSFTVDGDRWCGNIGRAHRSNGVWFVLDLVACTAVQRCWDPQCKYYSSPPITVPTFLCDQARGNDDDDEEDEVAAALLERIEQKTNSVAATTTTAVATTNRPSSFLDDEDDEWDEVALAAADAAILRAQQAQRK